MLLVLKPLACEPILLRNTTAYRFDTPNIYILIMVGTSYDVSVADYVVMGFSSDTAVRISVIDCESLILIKVWYILSKLAPHSHMSYLIGTMIIMDNVHLLFPMWIILSY